MTGEVHLERSIPASRDVLFRACSTPEGLEGWYADRVTGAVSLGKGLRLSWPDLGAALEVEVRALTQGQRIVFSNGESQVALSTSEGKIDLSHEALPEGTDLPGLQSSWSVALALLAHGLTTHPGRRRRQHWVVRRMRAAPELAHLFFTEGRALSRWLGDTGGIGAEGTRFSLLLAGRWAVSGTVLACAEGRDVAVSLDEIGDSFLSLRTLPSPSKDVRIVAACWSYWDGARRLPEEASLELARAMDRLGGILEHSGTG